MGGKGLAIKTSLSHTFLIASLALYSSKCKKHNLSLTVQIYYMYIVNICIMMILHLYHHLTNQGRIQKVGGRGGIKRVANVASFQNFHFITWGGGDSGAELHRMNSPFFFKCLVPQLVFINLPLL